MNIENIKNTILISDFLHKEGFVPVRRSSSQISFKAPYRMDNDPSLVVNDRKGVWYDHGEGSGGTIIELAMKVYNTKDLKLVVNRLNQLYNSVPLEKIPNRFQFEDQEEMKPHEIRLIKPLGNNFAIRTYLESRGVYDEAIKSKQVVEVYYDHINHKGNRRRYFGAGWKNNAGGYDIRSKYGKICIDHKDLLLVEGDSGRTNVFEGMMNFLSGLKGKSVSMKDTNIVLNSLSLSMRAIDKIKNSATSELNMFLDNGIGGDKFTKLFKEHFPALKDRRDIYNGFGDYNEKIMFDLEKKIAYKR